MFPDQQLNDLALQKQLLLLRGAQLRAECLVTGARLTKPFNLLVQAATLAKRLSPLLGLAALFSPKKSLKGGLGLAGLAMKWGPSLLRAFKSFQGFRTRTPE
jgi:hypothetical protein